ncbi:MAG: signal peptidase I [Clostridia bacterium]|nr:signal peptidase I [Clostridia bacterium]
MKKQTKEKTTTLRAPVRILLLALIGLILGVTVYSWNAKNLTGDSMPMPFGVGVAIVMSGSMEPTLSVNDLVIIQKNDSYEVGDIVVFQDHDGSSVIHKIISIDAENGTVQTQGDANPIPDEPIDLKYVKGKLMARIQGVGTAVRVLKSPPVVILVLAVSVLLLALSYRREKDDDNKKLDEIKAEIRRLKEKNEEQK